MKHGKHKKKHLVSDITAANTLGNGHPKCNPPTLHDGNSFPEGSTGAGSAPGANGPPTTGAETPTGPMSST